MSNRNETFERQKQLVRNMNIMDDGFFAKVAEDVPAMEEILNVILPGQSIQLKWSKSQVFLRNCGTRSVILDALCESLEGKLYSVEMEKSNKDDHQRRVRYNSSNIDTAFTEKGVLFRDIPEICMIYISKTDFLQGGFCVYRIVRILQQNGRYVDNGIQEIYVNAKIDDGSPIARLMEYMRETKGEHPLFPKLSACVKHLKEQQEGIVMVGEAVEKYTRERIKEATRDIRREAKKEAEESAVSLFLSGVDFEIVAKSMKRLSRTELEKIYKRAMTSS